MPQVFPHLHIILLCEDHGVRLWPIAREQAPVCLAPVDPESTDSLLSATVERVRPFTEERLHVMTSRELAPIIRDSLVSQAHLDPDDFELLSGPVQRGSAFAIALACAHIRRTDPAAVIAVFPTDQKVEVDDRWEHILYRAYQVALRDRLVVIGGQQQTKCASETYIRRGKQFENIENSFEVRIFSADAPPAVARRVCAEGGFWYTGIMVARAAVLLGELMAAGEMGQAPDTQGSHRIAETANFLAMLDPRDWRQEDAKKVVEALPLVSYEKAALETSAKLVVVPVTIPFSTISTLTDLDTLVAPDKVGNRRIGAGTMVDSRGVTVFSQVAGRSVVTLGLRDVLVVDTHDALLVASKDKLRDMNHVFVALREAGDTHLRQGDLRPFPWGTAMLVDSGMTYATWRVELMAGASFEALSIPSAFDRFDRGSYRERYTIVKGDVTITRQHDGASRRLVGMGDGFEAGTDDGLRIDCVDEGAAVLMLNATVIPGR